MAHGTPGRSRLTRVSATEELFAAVQARAVGTPYVVEPTPEGFDVRLRLDDPQWFGQLREGRLTQTSIEHVKVQEASRTIVITDEIRTLSWIAGTDGRERPRLGATLEVASGRVTSWNVQRTYSVSRHGITKESEVTFDASAGRDLVLDTATPLGWKLRRRLDERVGLYVGVTTIVLLVLAGIVVGVVALAGGFSRS